MSYLIHLPKSIHSKIPDERIIVDIVDGKSTIIQRAIRRDGVSNYQLPTTQVILSVLSYLSFGAKQSIVFYDIGCNSGYYTLLCKNYWKDSVVMGFEASKRVCGVANDINTLNNLDVTYINSAVSDDVGEAVLYLSDKSDASNSLTEGFRAFSKKEITSKVSLDDFVFNQRNPVPNFLKIDVELHEPQVLSGAKSIIEKHNPIIITEALKRDGVMGFYKQWASNNNYNLALVADIGLIRVDDKFVDSRVAMSDYLRAENDVLLVPKKIPLEEIEKYILEWRLTFLNENRKWSVHRIRTLNKKIKK